MLAVAAAAATGVGACDDAFTGEGQGGSAGSGGASSAAGAGGATEAGTATGTSAGTSAGTDAGTATGTTPTGMGGAGGGSPLCAHDLCDTGPPLDAGCDACVADICSDWVACCTIGWDIKCVGHVNETCLDECGLPAAVIGCNDQYGDTEGYSLCDQDVAACAFVVDPGDTCNDRCQDGGGRCLNAWSGGAVCDPVEAVGCAVGTLSEGLILLCICTVGCNGSAPCSPGTTVCTPEGCTPY